MEDLETQMNFSSPMEACFSPDSWSSASNPEGSLSLADLAAWAENALNEETTNSNGDAAEAVCSCAAEEEQVCASTAPEKAPHTEKPRKKARVVFSEKQLNILHHRFSLQAQLKPCEMKELAETTGLSYKQVKTWFQNRRMKLRRRNKVTWCSGAPFLNDGGPLHGLSNNLPPHVPHFQGEGRPPLWKQYNQDTLERNFRTMAPQNQAPYLAAVPASQSTVPNLPHMVGWSVPPSSGPYHHSPSVSNPAVDAKDPGLHSASFGSPVGEPDQQLKPDVMSRGGCDCECACWWHSDKIQV